MSKPGSQTVNAKRTPNGVHWNYARQYNVNKYLRPENTQSYDEKMNAVYNLQRQLWKFGYKPENATNSNIVTEVALLNEKYSRFPYHKGTRRLPIQSMGNRKVRAAALAAPTSRKTRKQRRR